MTHHLRDRRSLRGAAGGSLCVSGADFLRSADQLVAQPEAACLPICRPPLEPEIIFLLARLGVELTLDELLRVKLMSQSADKLPPAAPRYTICARQGGAACGDRCKSAATANV
jgi:hypothetical protein